MEKERNFTSIFFFNEFSVEFWKRRRQCCKSGVNHIGVKSLYDMFSGASIFRTAKKDFFKNHVTLLKLKPHRLFLKLFYSWGTWDKKKYGRFRPIHINVKCCAQHLQHAWLPSNACCLHFDICYDISESYLSSLTDFFFFCIFVTLISDYQANFHIAQR